MQEKQRFAEMIDIVLTKIIGAYVGWEGNARDFLQEVRHVIFERLNEIFARCNFRLSERSVRWLSDEYFKRVKLNGAQQVGELIILSDEVDVKTIPGSDLEIMTNLFDETDFADVLVKEKRRRS